MSENSGSGDQPRLISLQDIIISDSPFLSLNYNLPSEFFEKVLEYEIFLKEKFDPKIFFDLINYYSKAIEFYESINDPKFLVYNQALNFLFEQPEAKKFMEGKDLGKEFRKKEIIKRFKQCEKIVTEEKVKIFIEKRTNEKSIKSSIDNLYNKDIEKQKNNFKKKLEEKRIKYNNKYNNKENNDIKLSNQNENKENIVANIKDDKIENEKNENKKDEKIKEEDEFKIEGVENLDQGDVGEEQEEISEIDFNLDDVMELVNLAKEENKEGNNKIEDKNEGNNNEIQQNENQKGLKEEQKPNNNYNKLLLQKSLKRTNKTRLLEKLLENFDNYFNGYYEHFVKNNIDLIMKEFDNNEKELSKKVCESGTNYLNQIKDMEYLLDNKDNEESYKKEIGNIIKQLNGEKKNNIEKMISENDKEIKKINKQYIVNNILLKEKFKLDTTKLLNSFIFK